jgi:UDP-GlcNAc:undecaprenyl-phosphate GlcNAc-1-phosphate transferase
MIPYPSLVNILVFLSAITLSALGTFLVLRQQWRWGMDAPDNKRKHHEKTVSRLGGLPIFLTLSLGFGFMAWRFPMFVENWWPIILSNSLIFAVGFIDDLKPLGAKVKLLGQLGVACIVYAYGISIDVLSNPIGDYHIDLGWWGFPVTILWLIAIPNIVNLIDGMDGLATGFGMFLCITLAIVGHYALNPEVVTISIIMGGALTGFLLFNFPPARIFLGDGGAYLIGFFIASISLFTSNKGTIIAALLVVIIALGVPILDTLFAIIRRAIRGVPIFRADAEHIHHRLLHIGFSKARALVAIYSVCLVLSLIGISIFWSRGMSLPIAGAALVLLGLGAARYLGYVKSWQGLKGQFQQAMLRRREMNYASTYGRMLEWETERCQDVDEYITLFRLGLHRLGFKTNEAPSFKAIEISLPLERVFVIYAPDDHETWGIWLAKADTLTVALNLATERWSDFYSHLSIETKPESPM